MIQFSNSFQEVSHNCSTVIDLLRLRYLTQPSRQAFTFLQDGETEVAAFTYEELDRHSRRIAAQLQSLGLTGERALLLYSPGLDYLAAFFGCLYAGVIAVPAYPPRNQRNTPRIQAILADAQAAIALTTTALLPTIQSLLTEKANLDYLQWLTTDNLTPGIEETWREPAVSGDTTAFLQYTSGSTGTPKGVMVSHRNLLHNAATTYQFMEHTPASTFVSWLPTYHDMGLIGGILQPLYGGFPCILMPPASFLQRPYRWLQAISCYKGTTSGGPNFAFDLCVQKITPEQKATLDLSSWSVAFNGAEPIRHDTLERFAAAFASCGFRKEAFYPCYGMAEATLMISGSQKATSPKMITVEKAALESNRVVESTATAEDIYHFVSCGRIIPDQKVVIANLETLNSCQPGEVGEIWVSGPSIGQGYWNRLQETAETFNAYLSDTGAGPFLRTGDLGFLQNEELFITGRAKDVIIIRGRNLYPQDIELTAEQSHPSLRPGSVAAFTVEVDEEERLVIVQELEFRAKPNIEEVIAAIRQAVAEEHEVQAYAVVLIKPGSIAKTSSGKIQRRATRAQWQKGELDVVGSNTLKISDIPRKETRLNRAEVLALPPQEIQIVLEKYLIKKVAWVLGIAPDEIKPEQALSTLGLDSLKVFELKNRLEVDLEIEVFIGDFFAGISPRSLATKIFQQITTSAPLISLTQQPKSTAVHPLSFAQQRLFFIHHLATDSPTYNIPILINLKGDVNVAVLENSLNEIIKRHEVLRTNFTVVDGQPVQVINQNVTLTLAVEDLRSLPENERTKEAENWAAKLAKQPFDLASKSLLRAKFLLLNAQDYQLLVTFHHIISDGWSIGVFIRELAALYEAFSNGKPSPLPQLRIQYQDFVYWQQEWLNSQRIQPLLTYWKQKLSGELPILNLPTDRARTPVQTFNGAQSKLVLSPTLTKGLKNLSHQQGVTLFMTLLTVFKTLLYRYTGQTDILVGSPIASRNRAEIEPLIGFFVNALVLRTDLSGEPSFTELLARVKSTALEAYIHQDLPFEKLVEELQPSRDLSYNPLFQVMFVLQNLPTPQPKLSDISITCEEGYSGTSKFDLTLFMEDSESGLVATLEYNTDLFNADTITRMLGHFQTLLGGIIANPDQCIANLPLLTPSEREQLLIEWNNTYKQYPQDKCIHQLFAAQVEKTPDAIALIFEQVQLTYQELNNRANKIANYLQQQGVKPDVVVGICMERSIEMVVALLAILKAGGAYLPLDPAYPKERLAFMLADAQVPVLLTQQHLVKELPPHQAKLVCIDTENNIFADYSSGNPISTVTAENLIYVIYTSGSTGTPKGVMNTHQGVCNRLLWMQDAYQLTSSDRVLQKTPFSFDVSVWEFFWPLLTGASLVVAKPGGHQDTAYLVELISQQQITTLHFVPSMLQVFLEEQGHQKCESLKRVFCSGEALPFDLQQRFFESFNIELHNLYGPTEASIDVTAWQCQAVSNDKIVPIGRPIANTQLYILDKHLQPVPLGVPGELHIGGVGLARGYLNRLELTEEKFIPNPFDSLELNPVHISTFNGSKRLYKTGDLARYLPDGNIEFLGRIDHQVKIRGFRIELGEIEAVICQDPDVQEAVVVAREDIPSNYRLVAYIVPHQSAQLSVNELRDWLKKKLPDYMLPYAFVILDKLPLTANGKLDRRALPVPENLRPELTENYQAPESEIEKTIAQVWQQVLHLDKVGIHDNFFDLGGNSLLMLQANHKLRAILQRDISVVTMFQNPNIHSLVQYLGQKTEENLVVEIRRDRVQKQIDANKKQKELFMRQQRKKSR